MKLRLKKEISFAKIQIKNTNFIGRYNKGITFGFIILVESNSLILFDQFNLTIKSTIKPWVAQ